MKNILFLSVTAMLLSVAGSANADNNLPRLVKIEGESENAGKETYDYFYTDNRLDSVIHDQTGYQFRTKQILSYTEADKIASMEEMQWSKSRNAWTKANMFVCKYNSNGLLKSIDKKVIAGDYYAEYEEYSYEYDAANRLKSIEVYDYSRDDVLKNTSYEYDEQGRVKTVVVRKNVYQDGLKEYNREEYKYNADGQLIEKAVSVLYEGKMTPDKVMKYLYDEAGGCTKVETYAVGIGFPMYVTTYVNNNDVELKGVILGETPLNYFPDFEASKFVRLSEETKLADVNGNYTTNSKFTYTYADLPEKEPSGIETVSAEKPYRIEGQTLLIDSNGKQVNVYDLAGAEIAVQGMGNQHRATLPSGVYVLKVANETYKIYIP
ncbi:MAG: hypothetical protein SOZ80_05595 [Prevotella sp.]|uniref:hypothetical protein n=1 Tax=Prevotella sp. TaxID=59823 RepID=UPI002A27A6AD|nr:hypothetical protein [Prevotella sp.]MDD7318414.1 hypothetical protein [Prevotellaceae bacterium]MDY4020235.1 hypothetical protein [Prevotella sp.]